MKNEIILLPKDTKYKKLIVVDDKIVGIDIVSDGLPIIVEPDSGIMVHSM